MPGRKRKDSGNKTPKRAARGSEANRRPTRVRSKKDGHEPPVEARKRPRQDRSREMVSAILQAAAELFADLGYARTTTNKIAQRAGVSVGSLYQYFPNKDSLLVGLVEQHHADVHRVVAGALESLADPATPLEDGLRALITQLVALHQENPALTRALSSAVLRESPATDHPHRKHDHDDPVVAILTARADVRPGDRAHMAIVLGQATSHLTRWLVHDPPPQADPAVLTEEVTQMLTRYLRA